MTRDQIIGWLKEDDPARLAELYHMADTARRDTVGDEVHIRTLVEISNHCARGCDYCGLRADNSALKRYRMTKQEILDCVSAAATRGRKTVVLQSGEDPRLTAEWVAALVSAIKDETGMAVTLSLGEYSREDYAAMKAAGADRYLIKQETVNPNLYKKLHPDMKLENRIRCLETLLELGFQTGSGMMVGLPGQTPEIIADDILFIKKMQFDMCGIGPFIPNEDTPMACAPAGPLEMTLKAVALTRIAVPHLLMPATTAAGTVAADGRKRALLCGANVIMPNSTPPKYKELYRIYPGRSGIDDTSEDSMETVEALLRSIGRTIATGYGHSYKK
ncbi:MAG: [FeFe] hydrogenase H-cluster radical SAM maturase HydE [bacterium]